MVIFRHTHKLAYLLGQLFLFNCFPIFAKRIEHRKLVFFSKDVALSMVRRYFLKVERKYFLQVLLEVDHKCENSVILQCTSEVPSFFDENLIKVVVIKLKLVEQIASKQLGQFSEGIFVDFAQLLFQHILASRDDLIQVLELDFDMFFIHPFDIFLEILYFQGQQLRYLLQLCLNLNDNHIISQVILHFCVFSCFRRIQAAQANLPQLFGFSYSLFPLDVLLMCVISFTLQTELFIMVAEMRSANAYDRPRVVKTLPFVDGFLLLHR